MSRFFTGDLIQTREYYLLIYDTYFNAQRADESNLRAFGWASTDAAADRRGPDEVYFWERELDGQVWFVKPSTPLLVLEHRNHPRYQEVYLKILAKDKVGWIIYQNYIELGLILGRNGAENAY